MQLHGKYTRRHNSSITAQSVSPFIPCDAPKMLCITVEIQESKSKKKSNESW